DLAVAAHPDNVVSVLLGKGNGTFETHIDYATGNGGGNGAVALADFNRDGRVDLAMAGRFGDGIVGILVGKGDGTLKSPVGYDPAGLFGRSIAVGDFNGDGKLSLAVTFANLGNGTASSLALLPSNRDRIFSRAPTLPT